MEKTTKRVNTRFLAQLALLIAIQVVMRVLGLGRVPIGPLNMSFLTLPIAIGAMLMGPLTGAILGGVFGLFSLWDAISGAGGMTSFFFQNNPVSTVILCVGMRILMGVCCGLIFKLVSKLDRDEKTWSYFVGALSAPLLNTIFFMGYIILMFYNTEYIQNIVATKGALNPLHFVVLLVGVQGLIEAVSVAIIGGILTKVLSKVVKNYGVKR
ncbi:MAG: ECF transporter S component [Clostridia bacterium]|nr:ECF transporter S component [Clostridia bacterium]